MNESFKAFLKTLRDALLRIGVSNDILDRGSAEESETVYDQARRTIREAFESASPEDREVFRLLFGSKTEFDRYSWAVPYDYILVLLDRNPEISVERLRLRIPRFIEKIEALNQSTSAVKQTVDFHYTGVAAPSLLKGFLMLLTHQSEPPGCYYEIIDGVFTSFRFTLEGDGFTVRNKDKVFEYEMLLQGVWIYCLHPMTGTQQEIRLVFEKGSPGKKIQLALAEELAKQSWNPTGTAEAGL